MIEIQSARKDIVQIGRDLYERGMIVAGDGNISARMSDGNILCTPSGLCKGKLTADQLLIVDKDGKVVQGDLKPSSELKMHLTVYSERPDVHAVVHAHPPTATGYACAGEPLNKALLSEIIITLGCVPIAPYGTPSTDQVSDSIRDLIKVHDGMLLANHGALTVGPDLMTAYYRMETIEHFARISLVARLLGKENLLPLEKVEELKDVIAQSGSTPTALNIGSCPIPAAGSGKQGSGETISLTRAELIELIEKAVAERMS